MKSFLLILLFPLMTLANPGFSPQVEISGSGVGTLGLSTTADKNGETGLNFSDSALQIGAAEALYDGAIGSFVFGQQTYDTSNKGTTNSAAYFTHQSYVDYQSQRWEILVGRSDVPAVKLVEFPTLRTDDLVTLLHPLNAFSDGHNGEEHSYANVASVTLNQNLTYFENLHVQHLINSANVGTATGINSAGITFQYLAAPGLEDFDTFSSWGVGYEYVKLDANSSSGLSQIYGGATMSLRDSVVHPVDLIFQDTVSLGSKLEDLQTAADSFQADSNSVALALRFGNKPYGGGACELAVTAAYKNYFKIRDANSYGFALTAKKELGKNFEVVTQYQGQWREGRLAQVQSSGVRFENVVEVGLAFNFESIFNQHLSPRRSLLNRQNGFVPN